MAGHKWLFSLGILWLVLGILEHVECLCSSSDSQALLEFKGQNQSDTFSSWRNGSNCCRGWAGVTCDATATHVIALNLTGRLQLRDQRGSLSISNSVCELYELQIFNISFGIADGEYVNGTIPDCLWKMSAMRYVSISTLGQGGILVNSSLPGQVCNLQNLTHLDIGGISFEVGGPPSCLWGMDQLEHLNLTSIFASELLIAPVCNLTNLTNLGLTCNPLLSQCPLAIPSCIWSMTRLESLSLFGFSQPTHVSLDICNFAGLLHLDLRENGLIGDIPSCIWALTKLEHLVLNSQFPILRASISSDICNLKFLSHLNLELSYAHGYIPDCIWNMTQLEVLAIIAQPGTEEQIWHLPGSFSAQMCSLSKLCVLEISSNALSGVLPVCIWNMTQLQHLDLSGSDLSSMEEPTEVSAPSLVVLLLASTNVKLGLLKAIGNLSALAELDLSGNNITSLPDGIQSLSDLTSLSASSNLIANLPVWISNMSQLGQLQVSDNSISELSESLFNLSMLIFLDLSSNHLRQVVMVLRPSSFSVQLGIQLLFSQNSIQKVAMRGSNVTYYLDLSRNLVSKTELFLSLPNSTIQGLDLSTNLIKSISPTTFSGANVNGVVDLSENPIEELSGLRQLTLGPGDLELILSNITRSSSSSDISVTLASLECLAASISYLSFSSNNISNHLMVLMANLFSFQYLEGIDLSNNNISGDMTILMGSLLHNHTQLNTLDLSSNNISGTFSWFENAGAASNLVFLDMSRNQLGGELPRSLLSTSAPFGVESYPYLNVSSNQLQGCVPEPNGGLWSLDLSSNCFEGPLPSFSASKVEILVLSKNNFSGPIPVELSRSTDLGILDVSYNRLSGEIPAYFGNFKGLQVLDLSSNDFNGSLPTALGDCWVLHHLRVQNNSLHGPLPMSIGNSGSLLSVSLSHNHLEGSVPLTMGNCVQLVLIDLSHNNLIGTLPPALEKLSTSLRVFSVASNHLTGVFPTWIVNFTSLQVLDLSRNNFQGDLPDDYSNLSGFINATSDGKEDMLFTDGIQISVKGLNGLTFEYFLTTTTSFDVSHNNFCGIIAEELGVLRALRYLKCSENNFSGNIPLQLSNLSMLESLDLSRNSLTGEIPPDFGYLDGLSYFNVSDNHLTGEVPKGGQFNTFNESSFQNNNGLCGFPLPPCPRQSAGAPAQVPPPGHDDFRNHAVSQWISLEGVLVGVGTGFGAISLTSY